jgi:hypothetical protein
MNDFGYMIWSIPGGGTLTEHRSVLTNANSWQPFRDIAQCHPDGTPRPWPYGWATEEQARQMAMIFHDVDAAREWVNRNWLPGKLSYPMAFECRVIIAGLDGTRHYGFVNRRSKMLDWRETPFL